MARKHGLPSNVLGGSSVATRPIQHFKDWTDRFAEAKLIERARHQRKFQAPQAPHNIPVNVPDLQGTKARSGLSGGVNNTLNNNKAL